MKTQSYNWSSLMGKWLLIRFGPTTKKLIPFFLLWAFLLSSRSCVAAKKLTPKQWTFFCVNFVDKLKIFLQNSREMGTAFKSYQLLHLKAIWGWDGCRYLFILYSIFVSNISEGRCNTFDVMIRKRRSNVKFIFRY